VVTSLDAKAYDYYLYTELTAPPDFTLSSGESLILLIDGERYAFASANPQTIFPARRGFLTTFYRVSPEVLVDIANAQQVRLRLKGVNTVVERRMNWVSRSNIKSFLLKYFRPDTIASATASEMPQLSSTQP